MSGWGGGYVTDITYSLGFYRQQSPVMMALASIIGGAAAAVAGSHSGCDVWGFGYAVSGAVIVHGVGCLAGAIPMVVIGHRRIPVPTLMPLMVKPRGTWAERAAPVGLALAGAF